MTTTTLFGSDEAQAARDLIGGTAIGDLRNDLLKQILVATANRAGGLPSGSTITDIINQITNPVEYSVGYLGIPQNSQSADYTTVLTDSGKHIYHPSADTNARTWTIDSNDNVPYPIGTAITFINDASAGVITIAITSDTLVFAGDGSTSSRTLAASGMATAVKITSARWIISGTGLT
jgi:hypothetical protein